MTACFVTTVSVCTAPASNGAPGFFYKALRADALVLLDRVRFPTGRGWMHRNRVKSDQGDHWLRVPVWKAGRGIQVIADVEICNERDWRARQLRSLRELYAHAPSLQSYLPALEEIYARGHRSLLALNHARPGVSEVPPTRVPATVGNLPLQPVHA